MCMPFPALCVAGRSQWKLASSPPSRSSLPLWRLLLLSTDSRSATTPARSPKQLQSIGTPLLSSCPYSTLLLVHRAAPFVTQVGAPPTTPTRHLYQLSAKETSTSLPAISTPSEPWTTLPRALCSIMSHGACRPSYSPWAFFSLLAASASTCV